jgi:cytidine deaminase
MQKLVRIEGVDFDSLDSDKKEFLLKSKSAKDDSYAPYSEFYVGCSVLHENGHIGLGSNQENASFPSGLCAERVALFESSKNLKQNKVLEIAIYAESNKYMVPRLLVPCAGCLQVISDMQIRQKSPIKIYMWDGGKEVFVAKDVGQFLPFHFELKENRN